MESHVDGVSAQTPSVSSSSDFYADELEVKSTQQLPTGEHDSSHAEVPPAVQTTPDAVLPDHGRDPGPTDEEGEYADDDESLPMDLSRSSSPEPEPELSIPLLESGTNPDDRATGTKRRRSDTGDLTVNPSDPADAPMKRPRLETSSPTTPVRDNGRDRPVWLWQKVFVQVTPIDLVRIMQVCRTFHHYLTKLEPNIKATSHPPVMSSGQLWATCRKNVFYQVPRPLAGMSEYEMLRLIYGTKCQFCGKVPSSAMTPPSGPLNFGPGDHGVRVIWPFRVRSCGDCLEARIVKVSASEEDVRSTSPLNLNQDTEIPQSVASIRDLRLGISHGLWTSDRQFIADSVRHWSTELSHQLSQVRASKIYFKPDLDAIGKEDQDAREYGEAAAAEWRNGLVTKGKESMSDSSRWEKWELQWVPTGDLRGTLDGFRKSFLANHIFEAKSSSSTARVQQAMPAANGKQPVSHLVTVRACSQPSFGYYYPIYVISSDRVLDTSIQNQAAGRLDDHGPDFTPTGDHKLPDRPSFIDGAKGHYARPTSYAGVEQVSAHWEHALPTQPSFPTFSNGYPGYHPQFPHSTPPNPRQKSAQEVEAARMARKIEIERRCQQLQPPLQPNVLHHMKCFQNAMLIGRPLTDDDWRVLEPRIQEQREAAELDEHLRAQNQAALQCTLPAPKPHNNLSKSDDAQHQQSQLPLRELLGQYADDYIIGQWARGRRVNETDAPHFAATVLNQIKIRYDGERQQGLLESILRPATGATPLGDMPAPFLSLDVMKWVYEHKVRPHLEQDFRKLFICARCVEDTKEKQELRAFEALIQHYGSVHTSAFRHGNAVVRWAQAEWPDEAPFHLDPGRWIKSAHGAFGQGTLPARFRHTPHSNQAPFRPPHEQTTDYGSAEFQLEVPASNPHITSPGVDHETQLNTLVAQAKSVWDALAGVSGLDPSIRLQTTIFHAVQRFSFELQRYPSLELLADALVHHRMRPLKNAIPLMCHVCLSGNTKESYSAKLGNANVQRWDLLSLITHYSLEHMPHSLPPAHWTSELILVPENARLIEVMTMPGMDDEKLALIASALPAAFSLPLPHIGVVEATAPRGRETTKTKRDRSRKKGKKKHGHATGGTRNRSGSPESMPDAKNEYDPRHPIIERQTPDPGRYDTDLASNHQDAQAPMSNSSLTPEALASLQKVVAGLQGPVGVKLGGSSRSRTVSRTPSVGETRPPPASIPVAPANGTPTSAPDIAAILAQLNQAKLASVSRPPGSSTEAVHAVSSDQSAFRRPQPQDPRHYAPQELPLTIAQQNQAVEQMQAIAQQTGVRQDMQGYRPPNTRAFEYNLNGPANTSDGQTRPTTSYRPHGHHIYDGGSTYRDEGIHLTQGGQPAEIQYVELVDNHPSRHVHQVHPAPLSYTDEYGRQFNLIPIHAPPVPTRTYEHPPHPPPYPGRGDFHHAPQYPSRTHAMEAPGLIPMAAYDDRRTVYREAAPYPPGQFAYDDLVRHAMPRT